MRAPSFTPLTERHSSCRICYTTQVAKRSPLRKLCPFNACNLRGYAVIPGVSTSAMPVASVPPIKSYIHPLNLRRPSHTASFTPRYIPSVVPQVAALQQETRSSATYDTTERL